ncbi:MAG: M67 family metallopeptidase [Desulfovibrio sp.]|jgi:proteasome lid subunit RPN8/RPN11|nr:M67 family metallopeptidase [Desulfovibrio sp.]
MIRIPRQLRGDICAEGEAAYPDECCGIMLGTVDAEGSRSVTELQPMRNARESGERYHRFRIEADDILRAERSAAGNGLEIVGFYHSHPDNPAAPSDYDREHALPWYAYVIVEVTQSRARRIRCWQLAGDRSRFLRERMHTLERE